jgi:hypothetical protein
MVVLPVGVVKLGVDPDAAGLVQQGGLCCGRQSVATAMKRMVGLRLLLTYNSPRYRVSST